MIGSESRVHTYAQGEWLRNGGACWTCSVWFVSCLVVCHRDGRWKQAVHTTVVHAFPQFQPLKRSTLCARTPIVSREGSFTQYMKHRDAVPRSCRCDSTVHPPGYPPSMITIR